MDVTENGLRSAVKSLTDIVAPAIDPKDPLANEQLKLVIDYLEFARSRIDYLCFRESFELRDNLKLANALLDVCVLISNQNMRLFQVVISNAQNVLDTRELKGDIIRLASSEVAAVIREIIRKSASFEVSLREKIEHIVLNMSAECIGFERSWYLPLGFDPSPMEVPSLYEFINQLEGKNEK